MKSSTKNALLAATSLCIGVVAIPVAFFVNWGLGLVLLALAVYLIFIAG
jgi:hypothetical protein